jgi:hypothetical protein
MQNHKMCLLSYVNANITIHWYERGLAIWLYSNDINHGCQIFFGPTCQNGKNILNGRKMDQMAM